MAEKKTVKIYIPKDSNANNAKQEQFKYYQHDGVTVAVAIGKLQEVPMWVAESAKRVGDIDEILN